MKTVDLQEFSVLENYQLFQSIFSPFALLLLAFGPFG